MVCFLFFVFFAFLGWSGLFFLSFCLSVRGMVDASVAVFLFSSFLFLGGKEVL